MDLNEDLRPIYFLFPIDGLEKYLSVTEAQMEEVQRIERQTHESGGPASHDQEDVELFQDELDELDNTYEQHLLPAMRYSFVVLLHTVFENQIRAFCSEIQRDRCLPDIRVSDLRGSAIERSQMFLTKLAGMRIQDFPEWEHLRTLQKIRDCVVHAYGRVADSRDKDFLRELATRQSAGVSIDAWGRIAVTHDFCRQQLANLRRLFDSLFACAGWNKISGK
jgi:hypothetical protein